MNNKVDTYVLKKITVYFLFTLLISSGCAGRQPNPIQIIQNDDEKKSCEEINSELKTINKVGES